MRELKLRIYRAGKNRAEEDVYDVLDYIDEHTYEKLTAANVHKLVTRLVTTTLSSFE